MKARHRIAVIIGTRPEAIKLAPVVRELGRRPGLAPVVITTGQHSDLVAPLLELLKIEPAVALESMKPAATLAELSAALFLALGSALRELGSEAVLVQGDTTSALVGAMCAFYERIPVGHIEAGLRSGSLENPFPEELNRILVARATRWHFAPTVGARENLVAEGIAPGMIFVTGNTVIDNLLWLLDRRHERGTCFRGERPRRLLVTLHRRESQGAAMEGLARALARIVSRGDVEVVLPLHPSPGVRASLVPILSGLPGIGLEAPLDYPDFVAAMAECDLVLTDSGGVQEEAPALGKPVLVLRTTTERGEGVKAGTAKLVGTDPDVVVAEVRRLLDDETAYAAMARAVNPYGDGKAAERIVTVLEEALCPPSPARGERSRSLRPLGTHEHGRRAQPA